MKYITFKLLKCRCIFEDEPFKMNQIYDCFELLNTKNYCDSSNDKSYCVIFDNNGTNNYRIYDEYELDDFFTILYDEEVSNMIEDNKDNINIYR